MLKPSVYMYTCLFSLSTQCFNRIHCVFVKCFADPGMYSFFTNGADCILCVSMVMMACVCVFQRNMNNEETLELWCPMDAGLSRRLSLKTILFTRFVWHLYKEYIVHVSTVGSFLLPL